MPFESLEALGSDRAGLGNVEKQVSQRLGIKAYLARIVETRREDIHRVVPTLERQEQVRSAILAELKIDALAATGRNMSVPSGFALQYLDLILGKTVFDQKRSAGHPLAEIAIADISVARVRAGTIPDGATLAAAGVASRRIIGHMSFSCLPRIGVLFDDYRISARRVRFGLSERTCCNGERNGFCRPPERPLFEQRSGWFADAANSRVPPFLSNAVPNANVAEGLGADYCAAAMLVVPLVPKAVLGRETVDCLRRH